MRRGIRRFGYLYGDGGLDRRVRLVAFDGDVLIAEIEDRAHRGVEPQLRHRQWLTGQLQPRLVQMVVVRVGVAQRVHEVEIGRATCRERCCQFVSISVDASPFNIKLHYTNNKTTPPHQDSYAHPKTRKYT